jgi:hypothetical protein
MGKVTPLTTKLPAPLPVIRNALMVTVDGLAFVMVTCCVADVLTPTVALPKFSAAGATVTATTGAPDAGVASVIAAIPRAKIEYLLCIPPP